MVLDKSIGVRIGIDTVMDVDVGFDNKPLDFVKRSAQVSGIAANGPYFHRFIFSGLVVLFWREAAQWLRHSRLVVDAFAGLWGLENDNAGI